MINIETFDYTQHYKKGDIVYMVRCIDNLGLQEVKKIKLRTIQPNLMVGYEEKGCAYCISVKAKDNLFRNVKDANDHLKSIAKNIEVKEFDFTDNSYESEDDDSEENEEDYE